MLEVISDRRGLPPLRPAWDALAERHRSPLLGFDWFMSCLDTLHADDQPRIVLVREEGEITAIAPLCEVVRGGARTLELIGVAALYEPSGLLYADRRSLERLLRGVIALRLPAICLRMPEDPEVRSLLGRLAWRRAVVLTRDTAPAAYLRLPATVDALLDELSPNRRYDFRRKRKCLEKSGAVTLRIVSPDLSELSDGLREAMDVEDRSWKAEQGSSLLRNASLRAFFESYARKACEQGILRLCFIHVDGQPVSMHIAIESHGAFWVLKLGYDAAYAKCSPGSQLAMDTVEYSVQRGLSRYEFLGSEEAWQQAWPIERHAFFTVLLYPYSLAGMRGLLSLCARYTGKLLARPRAG